MKLLLVVAIVAAAAADKLPAAPAALNYAPAPNYAPAALSFPDPDAPNYSATAPQYASKVYQILKQEFDLRGDQSYDSSYETENGIYASESGRPVAGGYGDDQSYAVQGQYSYTGDDGVLYTVTYVADANGFQPQGDHLPTPVPTQYPTPEVSATEASYSAAPEPIYQDAPETVYQAAPEPIFQAAPEPIYQDAPEPVYQLAPEPIYQLAPEPIYQAAPEPIYQLAPEPIYQAAPEPIYQVAPEVSATEAAPQPSYQ